nr:blastoderm-specific protein 25D [Helicoverpa armigera]
MDEASMNRYEKQLYTVFKKFDVDNEEALDRSAVHKLCDALQLEDRGAALVNTLFERRSDRVTFAQFRNGLLAVLGGTGEDTSRAVPAPPAPQPLADPPQPDLPPHHSDEDSSGREVAPKFVFGSKKYGRRSRPSRSGPALDEVPSPRSSSASRLDTDDKRAKQRMRCRRSASAMESRDDTVALEDVNETFEHDRRIDRDEALALCRGLNMDGIDRRLVERIFDDAGTTDTTVGEFFDRLNSSLTTTMEEATREVRGTPAIGDSEGDTVDDEAAGGLASELVLEAWERAGVQQPRRLLAELGFPAAALRPPDLERALDAELRALPEPPHDAAALLLRAALALCRLRLERARRRADLATAERDKLRGDVAEANRHARILAQEVDESHARIEAELKASLKRAEARHAETTRQTAAEITTERERAAAALARLEAEVVRRIDLEGRLRGEISGLRDRADEAEARAAAAEERCADAAREAARLAGELREAQARAAAAHDSGAPAAHAAELRRLQRECQQLRDRNDELCAALETHARGAAPDEGGAASARGDLSSELHSLLTHENSEDCDSSPVSLDQKISGHVDAVAILREICEIVRDIPSPAECPQCGDVAAAVRRLPAARVHAAAQTDAPDHDLLADAERRHRDEKQKLAGLIKDLEGSLEQMKAEYDKCEDYWSSKLDEERDAWAEEQRLGDERLADLVAKIGEYERQFAPAPPLPTIDERLSLEAQVTDLEDEFQRYRSDKEAELSAARAECSRLAARLQRLEAERGARAEAEREAGAGRAAREVRELRARTARAEAAARRLTARLAAADLLVKDLYVENCQLAHRRPL